MQNNNSTKNDSTENDSTKNDSTENDSTENDSTENDSTENDSTEYNPEYGTIRVLNKLHKIKYNTIDYFIDYLNSLKLSVTLGHPHAISQLKKLTNAGTLTKIDNPDKLLDKSKYLIYYNRYEGNPEVQLAEYIGAEDDKSQNNSNINFRIINKTFFKTSKKYIFLISNIRLLKGNTWNKTNTSESNENTSESNENTINRIELSKDEFSNYDNATKSIYSLNDLNRTQTAGKSRKTRKQHHSKKQKYTRKPRHSRKQRYIIKNRKSRKLRSI